MQILQPRFFLLSRFRAYCVQRLSHQRQCSRASSSFSPAAATLDFPSLDRKWQQRWSELGKREPVEGAKKSYVLAMFPYPSGALHMGHLRVYTITDVLARFRRMQGHNLLYPMGWDAFGLPAENAAIERGLDPAEWTISNINKMKGQLQGMNGDIDWSREFRTCDPSFYKHTQRLFLLLHEHGLAYRAEAVVNYDPVDRTVLANEQVDANGFSWRSGAKVEKISLKQWFLRITAFKEALFEDLDLLRQWPERVIAMQRNWLGRSRGGKINFEIRDHLGQSVGKSSVSVFTTRPDTLFGVQYLCLSAGHPLVKRHAVQDPALKAFLDSLSALPEDSKVGYRLKDIVAKNPLSGLNDQPEFIHDDIPIYVSSYVLDGYGEGAVMGVPAHDSRDWVFWKQNNGGSPARPVIRPEKDMASQDTLEQAFTSPGELTNDCGKYAGLKSEQATDAIISDLANAGGLAEPSETWKLRDWLISRQRYWGTPIPIVHCKVCGTVPVPIDELPVELPKLPADSFRHRSGNPLDEVRQWVNTACPKCGSPAERDTDTMDTFMDSSWYMFRYTDPNNANEPFSPEKANTNMPVDVYLGGVEHAILHLLYARFIGKFLATTPLWPAGKAADIRGEPLKQQISQGMVHGKTYTNPDTGKFLKPDELNMTNPAAPQILTSGKQPKVTFEKMSKSKHNGVDPTEFIARYGADVTRAHMLFQAPVSEVLEWEEERITGVQRWLVRLWRLMQSASKGLSRRDLSEQTQTQPFPFTEPSVTALTEEEAALYLPTVQTICSVTTSLSATHALNICISALMSLTNSLAQAQSSTAQFDHLSPSVLYHTASVMARLLAPFAPAFAEECWEILHSHIPYPTLIPGDSSEGHPSNQDLSLRKSIFNHSWPSAAGLEELEASAAQKKQTCAVMENGKLRATVQIEPVNDGLTGGELEAWVLRQIEGTEEGGKWLARTRNMRGKDVWWKKIVVVKGGKTVNFVG